MKPKPQERAAYSRTASGYQAKRTHPLDPSRQIVLRGDSRADIEDQLANLAHLRRQRRHLNPEDFRADVRRLERVTRAPARVRELWDRLVDAARPDHARKLRSVWRHQLAPWFDGELAGDVDAAHLRAWDRELKVKGYAAATVHDAWTYLAAAIRAGVPAELDAVPWLLPNGQAWHPSRGRTSEQREQPAIGTVAELERVIGAALLVEDGRARAQGRLGDAAHRIAVLCLLALRNGEGSGLGWDDLVLGEHPRALVRHQAIDQWRTHFPAWTRPTTPPKGGRTRLVALHPTAIDALRAQRELLEARGWYRADGPVFPSHLNGEWRPNANCIKPEDFKRIVAAAGLADPDAWVTHSLRHSLATLESGAGADLRSIQKRTGHASLQVLEGYIHARTGRGLAPSAIPALKITFGEPHDEQPRKEDERRDERKDGRSASDERGEA